MHNQLSNHSASCYKPDKQHSRCLQKMYKSSLDICGRAADGSEDGWLKKTPVLSFRTSCVNLRTTGKLSTFLFSKCSNVSDSTWSSVYWWTGKEIPPGRKAWKRMCDVMERAASSVNQAKGGGRTRDENNNSPIPSTNH